MKDFKSWLATLSHTCDQINSVAVEYVESMSKDEVVAFADKLTADMEDEQRLEEDQGIAMFAMVGFLEAVRKVVYERSKKG